MRGKKIAVIVLAAGKGNRLPSNKGKLFVRLKKKPLIARTLEALKRAVPSGTFFCAFNPESLGAILPVLRGKQVHLVEGGTYRTESLFNVLTAIEVSGFDYILVHDGARPFVTPALVQRLFQEIKSADCCIPALPVRYTIKEIKYQGRAHTLNRTHLYEIQTPQLFHAQALLRAYRYVMKRKINVAQMYDDAQLIEYIHGKVHRVPGDALNIKITYPADIVLAKNIMRTYNR